MSRLVGVISRPTVGLGFRLAGLDARVTESSVEAARFIEQMTDDDRWGVILVQEDLISDSTQARWRPPRSGLPLIIPFPGPSEERLPGEAEEYVAELLKRAVGYRVRLR